MIPGEVLYKSESFSLPPVRTRWEAHRTEMSPWGREPTQPWRRAIGREEPGGSSGDIRGEGIFEAGGKGSSRVDRDHHPTKATEDERSSQQVVSSGGLCPAEDSWQCLETVLVAMTGCGGAMTSSGQRSGMFLTPYSEQDSPPPSTTKIIQLQTSILQRLGNPSLEPVGFGV